MIKVPAYCPHCWPTKRTTHFDIKLDYYFTKLIEGVAWLTKPLAVFESRQPNPNRFTHRLWGWYMELFSLLGLLKYVDDPAEERMNVRNLVFFQEGKRRGLKIFASKLAGRDRYSNEFKFYYNGHPYHYEGIPLTMRGTSYEIDNKFKVKQLLRKNGIPVPEGKSFTNKSAGIAYGLALEFPLTVKPTTGSLAQHVMCYINSEKELGEAVDIVKQYNPSFIVERYLTGGMHRGTVIDRKHVFICLRDRANVVGDGTKTIRQLMEQKNADPRRKEAFDDSASLHKMPFDEITEKHLAAQGLNYDSILPTGQRVDMYGAGKLLPDRGNDIINLTQEAHPDNVALFKKSAELLKTDLVGIDFIIPDIRKSHKEQVCGVLEANSVPYVDMHTSPSIGKSEPIVELIWDLTLNDLEKG